MRVGYRDEYMSNPWSVLQLWARHVFGMNEVAVVLAIM